MKILVVASILILAFCGVSFAQNNQNAKCPAFNLTGPATVVNPGDTGTFTASVNDENWANYIYSWTITGANFIDEDGKKIVNLGKKVEAVGKYVIRFQIPSEIAGESLTVTVQIKGFSEGCPNESSETIVCSLVPSIFEVDEFSISANQIDKVKLNALINFAQNDPSAQIFIIERFENRTLPQAIKRKHQKTIDYLNSIGIDVSRFTFINGYADKNRTQFILVPTGAERPVCDDCKEVKLK